MTRSSLSRLCLMLLVSLTPRVGLTANLEGTLLPLNTGDRSEQTLPEPPPAAVRIAAELGAGALTGAGLAFVGTRLGSTLCPRETRHVADGCLLYPLAGMWMGSSLGFALGVWWGGSLLGGRGHILHTLGGMALGVLLGAGAFLLYHGVITPVSGIALLMPYPLSIVAFELSSSTRIRPLVTVSSRGSLVLGLAGSF